MDNQKASEQMQADLCLRWYSQDFWVSKSDLIKITEILAEEGYRKADEVRKETAKEILQKLYKLTDYAKPTVIAVAEEYSIEIEQR